MQVTNYRTYLKGNISGTGSLRKLKLRVARHSSIPKKIVNALSQLPGVEGITTLIPHLEGKEIFGSTKRKLDLPPSFYGDSYRPEKVNFSQPLVQTGSRTAHTEFAEALTMAPNNEKLLHVTTALESNCYMSQWRIARILYKSNCKCHS
jgi:hypothetical protein